MDWSKFIPPDDEKIAENIRKALIFKKKTSGIIAVFAKQRFTVGDWLLGSVENGMPIFLRG